MNLTDRRRHFLDVVKDATRENVHKHAVRRGQAKAKRTILSKTGGVCEACHTKMPEVEMLHIHHVMPVSRGGTNAMSNVVVVCPNCHALAHWMDRTFGATRPDDTPSLLEALRRHRRSAGGQTSAA